MMKTAVDSLDVLCYKIGSFENTDIPLIRKAAATSKSFGISTVMATVAERMKQCAQGCEVNVLAPIELYLKTPILLIYTL